MNLTSEERKAIVEYRLEKADNTLDEARKIFDLGLYNLTANRLYYCVYYAATALLVKMGLSSHTHRGVYDVVSYACSETWIDNRR